MRTLNRLSYIVMFRKKGADDSAWDILGNGLFSDASAAKRFATTQRAEDEVTEVCELTTVYEVTP